MFSSLFSVLSFYCLMFLSLSVHPFAVIVANKDLHVVDEMGKF